jgi:K+-sensing histidine kinase KdpD
MNTDRMPITYFDSPGRSSDGEILREMESFKTVPLIDQLLNGFPEIAVILNRNRQLVVFNSRALELFRAKNHLDILGKRLGEALNCIHCGEMDAGCGTSLFCTKCGTAKAIKEANEREVAVEEECRITTVSDGNLLSFDFLVHARPVEILNKIYTMFAVKDISNAKRRETLERIFFHDIFDKAIAIRGLADILPEVESEPERIELAGSIKGAAGQLLNEITAQKELRNAEDGRLNVKYENLSVNEIILTASSIYKNSEIARDKYLIASVLEENIEFVSDRTLLIRLIGDLLKNAFEATSSNGTVKISSASDPEHVSFIIQNDAVIPDSVQLQMFQRSFSANQTQGRGIGLYSVRLILEKYLHGKVSFLSSQSKKTAFTISLSKKPV